MENLQNVCQTFVDLGVNTLHVRKCDLLAQHHLVKGANEEGIQETTMENRQANNTADELEVVQMLWVDAGMRVDLKSVVIVCGVFEEAVEWIKHLMR